MRSNFFTFLYKKLKIDEIRFFFSFLFHNYDIRQFNAAHVPQNFRLLFRLHSTEGLTTTRAGELIILSSPGQKRLFSIKNILSGGALQRRVEQVVYYTFVVSTLELNNPFDKKILKFFLEKKLALLEHLLDYLKKINGKVWNQSDIRLHIKVFQRNSLLQAKVIGKMHLAVKREKERESIKEAQAALKKGIYPLVVTVGTSGTYWMRGLDRRIIGLFKPFDEELLAPNNPMGPSMQGALGLRQIRRGCRVGESSHHEVGAFVVDEFLGFGIVPKTYYAQFIHQAFFLAREDPFAFHHHLKTKYGSFQEFVGGFVSIDELTREERDALPLDEFQLLVILDVIIGNTDRNINNILIGDEKLAAIDHGLCFTDTIEEFSYQYWPYFQQGKSPLLKPFIDLLNHFPFEELAQKLNKKCFISLQALQRMRERVVLFTEAINRGLVPSQMVGLFQPLYLFPLRERKSTLKKSAIEQVLRHQKAITY
jgi:hypothetical protein